MRRALRVDHGDRFAGKGRGWRLEWRYEKKRAFTRHVLSDPQHFGRRFQISFWVVLLAEGDKTLAASVTARPMSKFTVRRGGQKFQVCSMFIFKYN